MAWIGACKSDGPTPEPLNGSGVCQPIRETFETDLEEPKRGPRPRCEPGPVSAHPRVGAEVSGPEVGMVVVRVPAETHRVVNAVLGGQPVATEAELTPTPAFR